MSEEIKILFQNQTKFIENQAGNYCHLCSLKINWILFLRKGKGCVGLEKKRPKHLR